MPDLTLIRRSLLVFAETVGRPMAEFQAASLDLATRISCIVAPRQSGKSRSLALLAVHWAYSHPGAQVLIVSAGDEAAKRLLAEVRHIVNGSGFLRGSVVDEKAALLELTNGSKIRSVPASDRQIRGWSIDLLLIDEAALVSDDLILGAAFPTTAARPNARIVLASSATAASGSFYDHVQTGAAGNSEHVRTHAWALTDCPWISPSVIEAARESMTPARFAAEYEGKFASGADALFPRALLDRVTADYAMPGLDGLGRNAGLAGVDWGATADRTTLVTIGRLAAPAGVFAVTCAHAWPSGEPLDGPGGIIGQIEALPATFDQVSPESNGLGYPLAKELERRLKRRRPELRVKLVTTTQESKSATYSMLRMLFERGRLILPAAAPELRRELLLLRVEVTQSGGERIEAGVGHDDLADGLYLACGPYNANGEWRSRLGDATSGGYGDATSGGEPVGSKISGPTVETGGGLEVPLQPALLTAGGDRFPPPTTMPSPLERGRGSRSRASSSGMAVLNNPLQPPKKRKPWFEDLSGAEVLDRIRRTAPRDRRSR